MSQYHSVHITAKSLDGEQRTVRVTRHPRRTNIVLGIGPADLGRPASRSVKLNAQQARDAAARLVDAAQHAEAVERNRTVSDEERMRRKAEGRFHAVPR